jgi:hypothetical protein
MRLLNRVTGPKGERISVNEFVRFGYTEPGSAAMAHVPQVWAPLSQNIWRSSLPMSAMPWADIRLAE